MDFRSSSIEDVYNIDLWKRQYEDHRQSVTFTHTDEQQWWYLSNHDTDEVTFIKIWDSKQHNTAYCKYIHRNGESDEEGAKMEQIARIAPLNIPRRPSSLHLERAWKLDVWLFIEKVPSPGGQRVRAKLVVSGRVKFQVSCEWHNLFGREIGPSLTEISILSASRYLSIFHCYSALRKGPRCNSLSRRLFCILGGAPRIGSNTWYIADQLNCHCFDLIQRLPKQRALDFWHWRNRYTPFRFSKFFDKLTAHAAFFYLLNCNW